MTLEIILTSDEIKQNIPYQAISELRYTGVWDTSKCRRLWDKTFSKEEIEISEKLFRQARRWYINGVTESARFNFQEYKVLDKLAKLCASV